jgi:branched-chain amino acid transport system ATP-binding protein
MLEVRRLNAFYGQAQALFDVNFQVPLGSLVLVQGLNGAGKSTLLKSLMGLMDSVQGETLWKGQSLLDLAPHQRAQAGLGYVPEDRRLFSALTVRQNLEIAMPSGAKQGGDGPVSSSGRHVESARFANEWRRAANAGFGAYPDDAASNVAFGRAL